MTVKAARPVCRHAGMGVNCKARNLAFCDMCSASPPTLIPPATATSHAPWRAAPPPKLDVRNVERGGCDVEQLVAAPVIVERLGRAGRRQDLEAVGCRHAARGVRVTAEQRTDAELAQQAHQPPTGRNRPVEILVRLDLRRDKGWVVHHHDGVRRAAALGEHKLLLDEGPLHLDLGRDRGVNCGAVQPQEGQDEELGVHQHE
mmetsp:Transcript_67674/g.151054  ORF Transcript_67674/g.151054 Transcript_67674/m.151054 type:complete len:202 (-) Transcript_67674:497-1102(-)